MFKNAIEKIDKFYEINLSQNTHADEIFEVLSEIISIDSAAIFYLTPNTLTLEYGKNFETFEDIKISDKLSSKIYNQKEENITDEIQKYLNLNSNILIQKLVVKNAVYGIILIKRNTAFSHEEKVIFKTCTSIISNLIKDLELSKVLKMQIEALQSGIIETNKAFNTIKKQNKKIKENEKLQNEFIANISHDLRTPLNSIIGFSELLSNKIFGDLNPKQYEYVEDIRISGLHLLGMINEVLDISKIESHTIKLNLTEIDLSILINEVCNILNPSINKKHIKFIINMPEKLLFNGDYVKIQQVLLNLLGNAIKFSTDDSEIKIDALNKNNKIIIKVKDNGIGIDEKYHKKIFNKFFQIENSMSKTEPSTGLGLTITKEFVKLHKGKIEVESEQGKGTLFTITLPNNC